MASAFMITAIDWYLIPPTGSIPAHLTHGTGDQGLTFQNSLTLNSTGRDNGYIYGHRSRTTFPTGR
jgi:hypothetical protein